MKKKKKALKYFQSFFSTFFHSPTLNLQKNSHKSTNKKNLALGLFQEKNVTVWWKATLNQILWGGGSKLFLSFGIALQGGTPKKLRSSPPQ